LLGIRYKDVKVALNYAQLKAADLPTVHEAYGPDKCILYALGVGTGLSDDGVLGDESHYLFEDRLEVLPAMASVIAYPGFWMRDAKFGLDWSRIVHGEQRIALFGPLPVAANVVGHSRVASITDKGPGKGAVILVERTIVDAQGSVLARIEQLNFCRGDGGYSIGDDRLSDSMPAPIPRPPSRAPDAVMSLPTARNQAAIYRLCGDRNPLHIDRDAALRAGYPAPLMHGAATVGMVCRSLERLSGRNRSLFMSSLQVRFTGVMFPGESVDVQVWLESGKASFRCSVARDASEIAYGTAAWSSST
jgi:acyl dehydratase